LLLYPAPAHRVKCSQQRRAQRLFLQETKTKRGGKTYVSYLVRESFRTANGPRGRTICNLTHLPKEVRDMVAHALKGESLVPLEKLEVNNIHSFGGCAVLEDAARRYSLDQLLAPLSPRSASLIRAMIFGGLLCPPSVAPFYLEAHTSRLAMFCGLDPDRERFDPADLTAALKELDDRWTLVRGLLSHAPHREVRSVALLGSSQSGKNGEFAAVGFDAEGIPVLLSPDEGVKTEAALTAFLEQFAHPSKAGPPLLALDEETAARVNIERLTQPHIIDLAPESMAALLRQLNPAQLHDAVLTGGPVEARHHGKRHILALAADSREAATQEAAMRIGSLKELSTMTTGKPIEAPAPIRPPAAAFRGIATNVPIERLPAATAIQWSLRAQAARAAFAPVQIVTGRTPTGEGVLTWRNHRNLQFLTHWLRCHLRAEWGGRGETRPVEEVLRDLQEVHRAALTVNGAVVRRLATLPSKAVAAVLDRLHLWSLFESPDCGKK
jgi:hypothetical protein